MTIQALIVLVVIIGMLLVLAFDKMRPGMTLFSVVVIFMSFGIITPSEAVAGFSNKGMITVALLFLVSEGVRQSGCLNYFLSKILPTQKTTIVRSLARILPSIGLISAFLNNTAVVIIFAPIIKKWAEKVNLPCTKFLIPLSYATILGGVCTLIGTSTNLVVHGMMIDSGYDGLTMFELGKVGVPIAVAGILYIIIFGNYLLPGERILKSSKQEIKEYYYDIIIVPGSKFIGTNVRRNHFDGISQMEVRSIKRGGDFIDVNGKTIEILENDILVLAGKSSSIEYILSTEGIKPVWLNEDNEQFLNNAAKQAEAVLAPRFPGIGRTLSSFDFFRHYGAIVTAIHRNGERITVDLGSVIFQEGDTVVLMADNDFIQTWGDSSSFYMVSEIDDFKMPENKKRRWFALALVALMILGATFGERFENIGILRFDMFFFASLVMVIMAWTKLFPAKKYTKYISWDILIAIASAFAISKAMISSGIADMIAKVLIDVSQSFGSYGILAALYLVTVLFTEIITNNAAAALSFPIAIAVSQRLGIDPMPLFIAICIAASASFATPIGYQTNLIVQGIGGYKFKDYLRIGLPLSFIIFVIAITLIPLFWSF